MSARSRGSTTPPRPSWRGLYALAGVMLGALWLVQTLVAPGPEQIALQCGLVLGGFVAMVQWTRRNRAALDRLDWCDCASSRVTMRVIPSHSSEPARPGYAEVRAPLHPEPVGGALEEVER